MSSTSNWATQQLAEFVAAVSTIASRDALVQGAVEHACEALEAEAGAMVSTQRVLAHFGFPAGSVPDETLIAAVDAAALTVPGAGTCTLVAVPCGEWRLLMARSGEGFSREEHSLLRAIARVLHLRLDAVKTLEEERRLRAASERQVRENLRLLEIVRERQALLERLARIQRSISSRKPLGEVLDAIVAGAQVLIDADVVAVRMVEQADPQMSVVVSATGISDAVLTDARRTPVGQGVGGRAIAENGLVVVEDYGLEDNVIRQLADEGLRAVMAAPVRHGDVAVGSLLVASRTRGRRFTQGEQEVLVALAEHASLAINDARALEALRMAAAQAKHESLHDPLTGLPNRLCFVQELDRAAQAASTTAGFAVLYIDVDDFKLVNDSLGHAAGDELIRVVAGRLAGTLRDPDVVARLGGDEFAVLLRECTRREALQVAQRVLEAMAAPVQLVTQVQVSGSIGLLWSCEGGGTADDLLRDADVAMYRAKVEGKGRIAEFDLSMREDLMERVTVERDLRLALERDELVLHYQPIVEVSTGRVVGTEALLRWQHPERGLLMPASFIQLAEESGLVEELGRWALRQACRDAAEWRDDWAMRDVAVAVNVSPLQLRGTDLAAQVAAALAQSGLPAAALTLEITESSLVRDMQQCVEDLVRCKELGVRLAVDDFGTGYSSLSYLARLPLDVLKVDRMFVAALDDDATSQVLAPAIVALAQSMRLGAIAEGVETMQQWSRLRELGCERAQGFLFSGAVPVEQLPALVRARTPMAVLPRSRRPASADLIVG